MPAEGTQIDNDMWNRLEGRMQAGFDKMEKLIGGLDVRLRNLEITEAACRSTQESKLGAMEKLITDHDNRLDVIEKSMPAVRALIWLGGIVSLSVIGLIWGILTHTITIAVK